MIPNKQNNEEASLSETDIVLTKQDYSWHFIFDYLDNIRKKSVMGDKKFRELFTELYEYVSGKIKLPLGGDIADIYVVVEQRPVGKKIIE